MKYTIKQRIDAMRRTRPHISPKHARYLYARADDLRRVGSTVTVWVVIWSDDGRVSMHQTQFSKSEPLGVQQWADWLRVNVPHVMRESVLASLNRTWGTTWNIDRVFGWHFSRRKS